MADLQAHWKIADPLLISDLIDITAYERKASSDF